MSHAVTPATRTNEVATRVSSAGREPAAIQSDLETIRQRLAGTIDQLVYRSHPKTILKRAIDDVKSRFIDESGQPRTEEITKAAGGAVGFVAFMVLTRKVTNRKKRAVISVK